MNLTLDTKLDASEETARDTYLESLQADDRENVRKIIGATERIANAFLESECTAQTSRELGYQLHRMMGDYKSEDGKQGHPFLNLYAVGSSVRENYPDIDIMLATNIWYHDFDSVPEVSDLQNNPLDKLEVLKFRRSPLGSSLLFHLDPSFRIERRREIPDHYGLGLGNPEALWTLHPEEGTTVDLFTMRCLHDKGIPGDHDYESVGDKYFCATEAEFHEKDGHPRLLLYRGRITGVEPMLEEIDRIRGILRVLEL